MDTKVAIKSDLLVGMPFTLNTRLGLAKVFSYYGFTEDFAEFMQKACHSTRSYYVNANGLLGFLMPYSIIKDLERTNLIEFTKH